MSECHSCTIGSIQSNGHCDMCGFDEMQFINEWEEWTTAANDELEDWLEYVGEKAA